MLRNPLYQVHVEDREGRLVPLGPKMGKDACDRFADAIRKQISLGKEKLVSNPHVAAVF
jgi:hypothetical protein